MSDVVYLYGHGRRKHIQDSRPGKRQDATLCGRAGMTEDHYFRFTSDAVRDAITERIHARPLCAHCARVNWWLL